MNFLNFTFGKQNKIFIKSSISKADKEVFRQKWIEIQHLLKLGSPSNFKAAIVDADKLLEFILKKMGYEGTMSNKLKLAKDFFVTNNNYSYYNDVWEAHKARNRVVHEVQYELLSHEAHDILKKFESSFIKLGVL